LNGKLPELSSAIGLRQLEMLPDRLAKRQQVLNWYLASLQPLGCVFQAGVARAVPPFLSVALASPDRRERAGTALEGARIGWRSYYNPPIHCQPTFADVRKAGELSVTEDLAGRIFSLPLDDRLSQGDVLRVAGVVGHVVGD